MVAHEKTEGMLNPYRVLDLTDEKGIFCAKLLGDLGADVIKIEKPGGDPVRNIGPFYHDEVDPEKSLLWFAYNTNKRGITLDIETADGQEIFKKLLKTTDFVIESFTPGYLDNLRLGYHDLEKINPRVILISITPFGQTGPFKDYKVSDMVVWGMGGQIYSCGDPDRPPLTVSHLTQAYLNAGTEAAGGALMALHYRNLMGEGQHVDVSIQECLAQATYVCTSTWDMEKVVRPRIGIMLPNCDLRVRRIWPCKDGYVIWIYFRTGVWKWNLPLVDWVKSEGAADDFYKDFNWQNYDYSTTPQETVDQLDATTTEFFLKRTKEELFEGALERRAILFPVFDVADIMDSPQLAYREFWTKIEHRELGTTITYPGAFAKATVAPPKVSRRAPLIGEHNQEIYHQELGISKRKILTLQKARVI